MQGQRNELNFKGQDFFIGIDVHKKDWKVSIMSKDLTHKVFSQKPEAGDLVKYLRRNFPGGNYHSVYEAGFSGFWAHRERVRMGVDNIVVNAADVPTTQKERCFKTDRRDCRKIAAALRDHELEAIYIPSLTGQYDRSLVRMRLTVQKDLNRQKNRIKSMLNFTGIRVPKQFVKTNSWSNAFIVWLKSVDFGNECANKALQTLVGEVEHLRGSQLEITRQLRKLAKTETYCTDIKLLLRIPGIGLITGMAFLTQIETISRFPSTNSLACYLGLVPNCHSSGDRENSGEMTSRTNRWLLTLLVEAAWKTAAHDPALHQTYLQLCKRMKPNNAIIMIARKLLNRIYYVLKYKREYETGMV
jgi:transposase